MHQPLSSLTQLYVAIYVECILIQHMYVFYICLIVYRTHATLCASPAPIM